MFTLKYLVLFRISQSRSFSYRQLNNDISDVNLFVERYCAEVAEHYLLDQEHAF